MHQSIVKSSNVYYYSLANELGVDAIHDFMKPLGFGQITGIDINGEVRGVLPSQAWKRKTYKRPEQQKWYAGETISLGIGQGYNAFTMLQLAQATAVLANNGVKHKPRLWVATQDPVTGALTTAPSDPPVDLGFKPENVAVVRKALVGVTQDGTSARVFAGASYLSGGKTGTAQAVTVGQKDKYDARKLEEHQRDHALYMAFAPADDPKIALAIVVENAGFGAAHAAPIARRVFDYVLLGQYPNEEDLLAVQTGQAAAPIGKPRDAASVNILNMPGSQAAAAGAPASPVSATSSAGSGNGSKAATSPTGGVVISPVASGVVPLAASTSAASAAALGTPSVMALRPPSATAPAVPAPFVPRWSPVVLAPPAAPIVKPVSSAAVR
jgi:penicillin-binding protein 2